MANKKEEQKKDIKTAALITRQQIISRAIGDKTIADSVFNKIAELESQGGLDLPSNFSAANALKSAWLMFQDEPKLMNCTENSKANALLDMVIQGLSPAKNQCYFIPYGNKASMQRSYLGNVAVTKRLEIVDEVHAQAIYEGDKVTTEIADGGILQITGHKQGWMDQDKKVIGAYAIIHLTNGNKVATIMTMAQIKAAWEQGAMKGKSPAHNKFAGEMSKKTVINRACKLFLNTSDDSDLLVESINRTQGLDDIPEAKLAEVVQEQIEEVANTEEIDFEDEPIEEVKVEDVIVPAKDRTVHQEDKKKSRPSF